MISKTVCFTGHRPDKVGGYNPKDNKTLLWKLNEIIVEHIENKGVDTFINGVALGIDMWAARIVIKLKEKYPQIKLISAIPCRNHPNKWPQESKDEWKFVTDNSDDVILVTDEEYKPYLMQVRNEWMVNHSEYIIAVWDGSKGGTGNCVSAAEKQNKKITIINPKEYAR